MLSFPVHGLFEPHAAPEMPSGRLRLVIFSPVALMTRRLGVVNVIDSKIEIGSKPQVALQSARRILV